TDIPEAEKVMEQELIEKWNEFMNIRDDVLKALEEARDEKIIGKSLESKVTIVPKNQHVKHILESIPYLYQMLIVSETVLSEEDQDAKAYKHVHVKVEKHPGETCERCWVSSETVGDHDNHPGLCSRCVDVVEKHYTN
ncbi:MAG TPA: zinc finger domain-containing protein, partial [Virgibacillus sp.]|nr:zinc finger domain-containing protein [Virgibacillus sp.]